MKVINFFFWSSSMLFILETISFSCFNVESDLSFISVILSLITSNLLLVVNSSKTLSIALYSLLTCSLSTPLFSSSVFSSFNGTIPFTLVDKSSVLNLILNPVTTGISLITFNACKDLLNLSLY